MYQFLFLYFIEIQNNAPDYVESVCFGPSCDVEIVSRNVYFANIPLTVMSLLPDSYL